MFIYSNVNKLVVNGNESSTVSKGDEKQSTSTTTERSESIDKNKDVKSAEFLSEKIKEKNGTNKFVSTTSLKQNRTTSSDTIKPLERLPKDSSDFKEGKEKETKLFAKANATVVAEEGKPNLNDVERLDLFPI